MRKKDQNFIKKENQHLILDLIQNHDLITRAKLARLAKMSPTTVSRIVASLLEQGFIVETDQYTEGVGRKATYLALNPDSLTSIGVEIDETCIRCGLFNFLGELLATKTIEKGLADEPAHVAKMIRQVTSELIHQFEVDLNQIAGVCVGLPGLVDHHTGTVMKSAQLGWEHSPFGQILGDELHLPCLVDNELKLRAYAEKLFHGDKRTDTMVVIGFGSGVGSALIIGDDIYRGYTNSAGEIGHTVVDPNGLLCTCGNFGCLQTYIAERFLIQEASKNSDARHLHDIIQASKDKEKWAVNILERAITYAAITVNNCVCLDNPNKVILTGKMIEQSPYMCDRILQSAKERIWDPLSGTTTIEVSKLGEKGVMLGAAMYAQRQYMSQLNYEKELI